MLPSGERPKALRRVVGIGLTWAVLHLALAMVAWVVISIVDPASIDPGEGPLVVAGVFVPMGFLTGVVFGLLLSMGSRTRAGLHPSPGRAALWGVIASAIVQVAYLGHGDQGVTANIPEALLLSALGGIVAMAWLGMAGTWSRRPSSATSSP